MTRMNHTAIPPLGAAMLALAAIAHPLAAQQRTEMVPAILANAAVSVFAGMFDEKPKLINGRLPAEWPSDLTLASPARVVGGASLGIIQLGLFTLPGGDPVGRFESLLVKTGATVRRAHFGADIEHGFAAADTSATTQHAYCRKDGAFNVSLADSARARKTILVTWIPLPGPAGMRTPCNPAHDESAPSTKALVLPPLTPPRGVRVTAEGYSSSNDNRFDFYASTDTSVSADSLVAHYAREFAKGGWTAGAVVANREVGAVSLTKPDEKGPWRGAFTVTTGPDRRQLVVRMMRAEKF